MVIPKPGSPSHGATFSTAFHSMKIPNIDICVLALAASQCVECLGPIARRTGRVTRLVPCSDRCSQDVVVRLATSTASRAVRASTFAKRTPVADNSRMHRDDEDVERALARLEGDVSRLLVELARLRRYLLRTRPKTRPRRVVPHLSLVAPQDCERSVTRR